MVFQIRYIFTVGFLVYDYSVYYFHAPFSCKLLSLKTGDKNLQSIPFKPQVV